MIGKNYGMALFADNVASTFISLKVAATFKPDNVSVFYKFHSAIISAASKVTCHMVKPLRSRSRASAARNWSGVIMPPE